MSNFPKNPTPPVYPFRGWTYPPNVPNVIPLKNEGWERLYEEIWQSVEAGQPFVAGVTAGTGSGKSRELPLLLSTLAPVMIINGHRIPLRAMYNHLNYNGPDPASGFHNGSFGPHVSLNMGGGVSLGNQQTAVEMVTDGWLLDKVWRGPFEKALMGCRILIFDDVHKSSPEMEALIQLLPQESEKAAAAGRPLIILYLTATLNMKDLNRLWGRELPVFDLGAPTPFPIHETFLDRKWENRVLAGLDVLEKIMANQYPFNDGSFGTKGVVWFVTGQLEGEEVIAHVKRNFPTLQDKIHFLHGKTPAAEQQAILLAAASPPHITVATTVAESSITIPNVSHIINGGVAKHLIFLDDICEAVLVQYPVANYANKQRKGRTGRQGEGYNHNLYSPQYSAYNRHYGLSSSATGDCMKQLLYHLRQYPGTYPDAEDMRSITPLYVEYRKLNMRVAVHLAMVLKLVHFTPSIQQPSGLTLAPLGDQVLLDGKLNIASALLWAQAKPDTPLRLVRMIAQMASVLNHRCEPNQLVGRFEAQKRADRRKNSSRATLADVNSLNCGRRGDLIADRVELYNACPNKAKYFGVNPTLTQNTRDELKEIAAERLAKHTAAHHDVPKKPDPKKPDDTIDYAALNDELDYCILSAMPHKLIKVYKIQHDKEKDNGWVQARKLCTGGEIRGTSVSIDTFTAFPFYEYITQSKGGWRPSEDLYFIYTSINVTGSGGYTVGGLHRIPEKVVDKYSHEEWDGRLVEDFQLKEE